LARLLAYEQYLARHDVSGWLARCSFAVSPVAIVDPSNFRSWLEPLKQSYAYVRVPADALPVNLSRLCFIDSENIHQIPYACITQPLN
jgi:hypothetical protein